MFTTTVTGASLPSKLCEELMQLEIKCMKEMNVYTLCEHGGVKEQGLTPIGTRWVFTNKGDTEHPFIWARLVAQETKRTTSMDLTDTSMTFAATPRAHFHSPVRRKVAIRMQSDLSCPSGIAMLYRAMYGTKDAAQCFDSYCHAHQELLCFIVQCMNRNEGRRAC